MVKLLARKEGCRDLAKTNNSYENQVRRGSDIAFPLTSAYNLTEMKGRTMKRPRQHNHRLISMILANTLIALSFRLAEGSGEEPFNRFVIVVDRSGSFAANLPVARKLAWRYIVAVASTSSDDEIYIIGVDKKPSQIAYIRGVRSRRRAEEQFESAFARTTTGLGTDWVTGLREAVVTLSLPRKPASSHLLVFGDLLVDDEKEPSSGRLLRRFQRLSQFDWNALTGVHCSFWFVDEMVRRQLLANESFRQLGASIYAIESTARAIELQPPLERDANHPGPDQVRRSWLLWVIFIIVIVATGASELMLRGARRSSARRERQ